MCVCVCVGLFRSFGRRGPVCAHHLRSLLQGVPERMEIYGEQNDRVLMIIMLLLFCSFRPS